MKDNSLHRRWIGIKDKLTSMTWGQRVEYIWTYHKTTIVLSLIFLYLLNYLLIGKITSKDILIGAIHANVELSENGRSFITSDFFEMQQGDPQKEDISILDVALTKIADDEYFEMNYYYLQVVLTQVGAQQVDYILADKIAMEIFMTQDIYMNLRDIFSADELANLEDRLIYLLPVDENGESTVDEKFPVAIDVSGMPFFAAHANSKEPIYFSVASNAPNTEAVIALWTYLTTWCPSQS